MDFRNPLQSIIPGATGRILTALGRTTAELNLRTVADIADVSIAQTSRTLRRLVEEGIVSRREAAPSSLFAMNRQHVTAPAIEQLLDAPTEAVRSMRAATNEIKPPPVNISLFGSVARGSATSQSDIDVLVIRPSSVDEDDDAWASSLQEWAATARRVCGNQVNIIEIGADEAPRLLRAKRPPWREIVTDGMKLTGRDLRELSRA